MGKYEAPRNKPFQKSHLFPQVPAPMKEVEEVMEQEVTAEVENIDLTPPTNEVTDRPIASANTAEDAARKRKLILIGVCAGFFALLIGLIVGILIFAGRDTDDELILDNVYVADINLGGMTVGEAKSVLHLATDRTFSVKDMVVYLANDLCFVLSPEQTGAKLNVDAVVQAAYNHGREGSDADYQKAKKEAATTSYTIPLLPYLSLNLDYIRQATEEYCAEVYSVLTEPKFTITGERPTDHTSGSVSHQTITITLGTPDYQIDSKDLYDRILDAYSMHKLELQYDKQDMTLPTAVKANDLFKTYCVTPQDAYLDTTTYQIIPEVYGYGFQAADVQKQLDAASYGDQIQITLGFLPPKVFASDLTEKMFADTLSLAQTSSDINNADRNHNLKLACEAIDQYVINVGETFSLNKVLGKLTKANGYKEAMISQYNDKALGGGVSQVASALYCTALQANLDVTQRHCHEYAVDFIDFGLDAFVDGGDHDLRIKNTGKSPIRISATAENHTVRIELHGINTLEHKIELRTSIVEIYEPKTTYADIDFNNAANYEDGDVLQEGVNGYKIAVYLEKLDPVSKEVVSSKAITTSEYKSIEKVAVRIIYTDPEIPAATLPNDDQEDTGPLVPLGE